MTFRPRCTVFIATSLDGYIARPDHSLDFLERVAQPGEDYGYAEIVGGCDALVMGRATYDVVAGMGEWPYRQPVYVLTNRVAPARDQVVFTSGSPANVLDQLAAAGVRHAYVDGGRVIGQFLAAGLIDELVISIIPVILGDGIRLFRGGEGEHALALVASRSWPSGLVQVRYRRAP